MSKLFIVTGDYSGDKHAAALVKALFEQSKDITIEGVGGVNLENEGVKLLFNQDKMNSMGMTPKVIFDHILMGKRIVDYLKIFKPDIVLLIDYGAFNLQLAKALKKEGLKVFYFIPPQVWASRKWRLKTIQKYVDKVFTIFPFEKEFYEKEGVKSIYVGHPLLNELKPKADREEFFNRHNLDKNKKLIGVFPGSRKFEIKFLFKIFENAVKLIEKKLDNVQFVFSKSINLPDDIYNTKYQVIKGENQELLSCSDVLILASGTVALEACLYETPMIIAYRGPFLFYLIYLLVRTINKACLVNIITNKDIVPEFLMYNADEKKISDEIISLLSDNKKYEAQKEGLREAKALLGNSDCINRVCFEIIEELEKNG